MRLVLYCIFDIKLESPSLNSFLLPRCVCCKQPDLTGSCWIWECESNCAARPWVLRLCFGNISISYFFKGLKWITILPDLSLEHIVILRQAKSAPLLLIKSLHEEIVAKTLHWKYWCTSLWVGFLLYPVTLFRSVVRKLPDLCFLFSLLPRANRLFYRLQCFCNSS